MEGEGALIGRSTGGIGGDAGAASRHVESFSFPRLQNQLSLGDRYSSGDKIVT